MNKRYVMMVAVSAAALLATACTQVTPGHVGIKVNQYGGGAGVDPHPYGVGTYLLTPGVHYVDYPTFTVTKVWSRSSHEGRELVNEEFNFQDKGGLSLSGDVAISYHIDPGMATVFYQKYRQEMDVIEDTQLRNEVRNAIVKHASDMTVEDIIGPKKAELIAAAEADVRNYFKQYGLVVEQLYWAGNIRPPQQVLVQINQKIANEQAALAAKANVATAEANAQAKIAEAKGKADSMALEAKALRENPEMAQLRAIETWDGHLPTYMGGGQLPFINLHQK